MSTACTACGSKLTTIEYQARSADEATRQKTTCPSCPINASKISISAPRSGPRGLDGFIRHQRSLSQPLQSDHDTQVHCLYVEVPKIDDISVYTKHITSSFLLSHKRTNSTSADITVRSKYNVTGPLTGKCSRIKSTDDMGFGAQVTELTISKVPVQTAPSSPVVVGSYFDIHSYEEFVEYRYKDQRSGKNYIVTLYNNLVQRNTLLERINFLYATFRPIQPLRYYIDRRTISEYANLCPRAWDVSVPPQEHVYTSKPDGDRKWLLFYKGFWYAFNCHGDRRIFGWWPISAASSVSDNILLFDTEYEIGTGFIFIDSLTTTSGKPVPITRDLRYSLDIVTEVKSMYPDCPLVVRQYFDNNDEALRYSLRCRYSTDGTLGIRNGSTETVKVKPVKGADLMLNVGGNLTTSDGDLVAVVSSYPIELENSVVEVRFTANANDNYITVLDMFQRTNKTTPNSTAAVSNILSSCVTTAGSDDADRTATLKWCNSLRRLLVEKALAANDTKHIILDVGTGTGQSLDDLSKDGIVSFVHVEPDAVRAKSVARRLQVQVTEDPAQVGYMIKTLKTRKVQHVVLNCTLQTIASNEMLCSVLMPEVKCVVATFSAQYAVESLHVLREKYACNIVACMYTYDNAYDNVLVNTPWTTMSISGDDEATVKWGKEKEYTEPLTYEADYYGLGTVVLASDIQRLPSDKTLQIVTTICRHIRVIVP